MLTWSIPGHDIGASSSCCWCCRLLARFPSWHHASALTCAAIGARREQSQYLAVVVCKMFFTHCKKTEAAREQSRPEFRRTSGHPVDLQASSPSSGVPPSRRCCNRKAVGGGEEARGGAYILCFTNSGCTDCPLCSSDFQGFNYIIVPCMKQHDSAADTTYQASALDAATSSIVCYNVKVWHHWERQLPACTVLR